MFPSGWVSSGALSRIDQPSVSSRAKRRPPMPPFQFQEQGRDISELPVLLSEPSFLESRRERLTNLDNGICVRHIIDTSRHEVLVSSCPNCLVCLRNLFPQPLLDLRPPREFPQHIHHLQNKGYRTSSYWIEHLDCSRFLRPCRVQRASASEPER